MAVRPFRGPFTVEDFHRLAEVGVLREGDRVELVDGQVVEMSPIGGPHAACVRRLIAIFARHVRDVAVIDVQDPIVLGPRDQPQPDITLLRPRADGYRDHPRPPAILLVVEVADTTLAYDRGVKVPLYARAGIPEAWLVDLGAERIHIHRDPAAGGYRSIQVLSRGEAVTPLAFPDVTLAVGEILG
jgi:Uma2 family endonuclease